MGLAVEAVGVVGDAEHLGEPLRARARDDRVGQDDHVGLDGHGLAGQRVGPADDQLAVLAAVDAADAAADVLGAVGLDGAADELLVALAGGPDVHVEDHRPALVHLVLVEDRVLGGVHAADLGAVGLADLLVAAAAALDEDDRLRHRAVGRPADLAAPSGRWPRRAARTGTRR